VYEWRDLLRPGTTACARAPRPVPGHHGLCPGTTACAQAPGAS